MNTTDGSVSQLDSLTAPTERKPKHAGGRPKGSGGRSISEKVLDAALRVAHRALTLGVEVVGSDGKVVMGPDGKPLRKPCPASFLAAATKLLEQTGALEVARKENQARAEQRRLSSSRFGKHHAAIIAARSIDRPGVPPPPPSDQPMAQALGAGAETMTDEERRVRMAKLDREMAEIKLGIAENKRLIEMRA